MTQSHWQRNQPDRIACSRLKRTAFQQCVHGFGEVGAQRRLKRGAVRDRIGWLVRFGSFRQLERFFFAHDRPCHGLVGDRADMGMNKDPTDKDLTAISWDDRQIRLRALTSSRQVPWQSVESVQTVRRVVRANFVVTVAKSYEMVFRLRHNGSRRKVKINAWFSLRLGGLRLATTAWERTTRLISAAGRRRMGERRTRSLAAMRRNGYGRLGLRIKPRLPACRLAGKLCDSCPWVARSLRPLKTAPDRA